MRELEDLARAAVRVAPGAWLPEEISIGAFGYIVRFMARATPDAVLALLDLIRVREGEITTLNNALLDSRRDLAAERLRIERLLAAARRGRRPLQEDVDRAVRDWTGA